jgi:uncharacterized membrane protein YfcA
MPNAQLALIALAGFAAGAVNALAGGGTLISFPALVAVGLSPLAANITSTIALCPGFLGATYSQRSDLRGQRKRLYLLLPCGLIGGVLGAALLLKTGERKFTESVPWLLLGACALLASQEHIRRVLAARSAGNSRAADASAHVPLWLMLVIGVAAIYGGFFGPGMSVMMLAVLGLAFDDSLTRLNALKQPISMTVSCAAALLLALRAPVDWKVVGVLAISALLGGMCGGTLAGRLSPQWLRRVVVLLGIAVALVYVWRAHLAPTAGAAAPAYH